MDVIDRLDKMQKESYLSLIDSSKRILENINSQEFKLDTNKKLDISQNIEDILQWLNQQNYTDITQEKYKELLHDYKMNYSIYLIQNNQPIINLESAEQEDNKGIEIYEDDTNKKYEEQIKYFRSLIDEYDTINKQIKLYSLMECENEEKTINKNNLLNKLNTLFNSIYEYANDTIIKLFINTNLTDDLVNEYCTQIYNLDIEFKELFDTLDKEYNIIGKLINKIKDKENFYLEKLSNSENNELITLINIKLDKIIEFDSWIYKMNNSYIKYDFNKIIEILNEIELL